MKFTMRRAKNGLILKSKDGELLYTESDTDGDDIDRFYDFLYTILEHYGPMTSRHSPKRIYIDIRPGDKWLDAKLEKDYKDAEKNGVSDRDDNE